MYLRQFTYRFICLSYTQSQTYGGTHIAKSLTHK